MKQKVYRGLFCLLLLLSSSALKAQYTILNDATREHETRLKSIMPMPNLSALKVINSAYERNERKKQRFNQNFIQTNAYLTMNQFAYKNVPGAKNTYNGRFNTYIKHIYTSKTNKFRIESIWESAIALGERDDKLWKTEDWLKASTNLSYQLHKRWSYSFSTTVQSQFVNSFDNPKNKRIVSSFFAPATINVGVGLKYTLDKDRNVNIEPTSGRLVVLCDEDIRAKGGWGVKPHRLGQGSFGATVTLNWRETIFKGKGNSGFIGSVSYRTWAKSFTNYKSMPDLTWDNWVEVGISRIFSVSLYCRVLFNDKLKTPENSFWQVSQNIGLTLKYERKNK